MANLIAVTFEDETAAFSLRAALGKLQREYLIDMEDVIVVTRDESGQVKLHQSANLTAVGALAGSFWGLLIGMIFRNPLLGATVGAGAGALSGRPSDLGIDDRFMKELGEGPPAGGSALFVLVSRSTPDKVMASLEPFRGKGKALQTSLSKEPEIVAGTWKAARAYAEDISEADARAALQQLDPLWDELFPAEQARIVALLVERVDIGTDGLNVRLRVDGLGSLAREILAGGIEAAA